MVIYMHADEDNPILLIISLKDFQLHSEIQTYNLIDFKVIHPNYLWH